MLHAIYKLERTGSDRYTIYLHYNLSADFRYISRYCTQNYHIKLEYKKMYVKFHKNQIITFSISLKSDKFIPYHIIGTIRVEKNLQGYTD